MKIISKFHNYYDGVGAVDPSIIYHRVQKDFTMSIVFQKTMDFLSGLRFRRLLDFKIGDLRALEPGVLGFCGVTHPFVVVDRAEVPVQFLFDQECLIFLKEHNKKETPYLRSNPQNIDSLARFAFPESMYHEYNIPILQYSVIPFGTLRDNVRLRINPCLRDLRFGKIIDPYTAFQEIQMYLSGVLTNNPDPPVKVSDRSKILGKGFDYKWSFRKRPK